MKTLSFYSYKGGVGRTMFLANAARLLASQGKKVVAIDLDLEAPGLLRKFNIPPHEEKPGVLDYIIDICEGDVKSISNYLTEIPISEDHYIWAIGAGSGDHKDFSTKLNKVSSGILSDENGVYSSILNSIGLNALNEIKERVMSELPDVDYFLIDCRTGVTEIGAVALQAHSDILFALYVANTENRNGIAAVINSIAEQGLTSKITPILSRVPAGTRRSIKLILEEEKSKFNELLDYELGGDFINNLEIIISDANLQISGDSLENLTSTPYESPAISCYQSILFENLGGDEVDSFCLRDEYMDIYSELTLQSNADIIAQYKENELGLRRDLISTRKTLRKVLKGDQKKLFAMKLHPVEIESPNSDELFDDVAFNICEKIQGNSGSRIHVQTYDNNDIITHDLSLIDKLGIFDFISGWTEMDNLKRPHVSIVQIGYCSKYLMITPSKNRRLSNIVSLNSRMATRQAIRDLLKMKGLNVNIKLISGSDSAEEVLRYIPAKYMTHSHWELTDPNNGKNTSVNVYDSITEMIKSTSPKKDNSILIIDAYWANHVTSELNKKTIPHEIHSYWYEETLGWKKGANHARRLGVGIPYEKGNLLMRKLISNALREAIIKKPQLWEAFIEESSLSSNNEISIFSCDTMLDILKCDISFCDV